MQYVNIDSPLDLKVAVISLSWLCQLFFVYNIVSDACSLWNIAEVEDKKCVCMQKRYLFTFGFVLHTYSCTLCSYGLWHCVASQVITNILEKHAASIFISQATQCHNPKGLNVNHCHRNLKSGIHILVTISCNCPVRWHCEHWRRPVTFSQGWFTLQSGGCLITYSWMDINILIIDLKTPKQFDKNCFMYVWNNGDLPY